MYLYHYFEKSRGPFRTLSDISFEKAKIILSNIKINNPSLTPPDIDSFLSRRQELETLVYQKFIEKGGEPVRKKPQHMTVEKCDYLETWYSDPDYIKIPIEEFDINKISFTYGDMFPVFNPRLNKGEEYRNEVYTYDEILVLIKKYGLPQFIDKEYEFPAECYIEACIWDDKVIDKYKKDWKEKNKKIDIM